MSHEQLPLTGDGLPLAFVARWRELERTHGMREATLECERYWCVGPRHWLLLRIDGRAMAKGYVLSVRDAAERLFHEWRP